MVKPDYTIIDGFHRWTVAQREPLKNKLAGMVPVVIVDHKNHSEDIYGTITHNRARGTHVIGPMKAIVRELVNAGTPMKEIEKQTGMKKEEIFRLSDFSREDFLDMMSTSKSYSQATLLTKI